MRSQGKMPPSPEGEGDITVTILGKCHMPTGGTSSSSFLLLGSSPESWEVMEEPGRCPRALLALPLPTAALGTRVPHGCVPSCRAAGIPHFHLRAINKPGGCQRFKAERREKR